MFVPDEMSGDKFVLDALLDALALARSYKPEERSQKARQYAVAITELEKVTAYFYAFVIVGEDNFDELSE